MLTLTGISKSYGAVRALRDVDFRVAEGEVVGLVGDNGAGKSTLIRVISGVGPADSGEIRLDDGRSRSTTRRTRSIWGSPPSIRTLLSATT